MRKMLVNFIIIFFTFLGTNNICALGTDKLQNDANIDKEGSIILREVLLAHQMLANTNPSDVDAHLKILGSIVLLGEKKYKILSFKFENAPDITSDETFEEYAERNNLFYMKSVVTNRSPEGAVTLEVFDSSRANLDDGVSFNISLSPLDEK